MSKTWKWILGIIVLLVVVGGLFAIGFMWRSHMVTGWAMPFDRDWNTPMYRPSDRQWNQQMPMPWNNHPMMDRRGYTPFGGFFMLGGLLKGVLFLGLLYGAYWLGRRNARLTIDPKPVVTAVEPPTPAVEPEPTPHKRARKVK